MDQRFDQVEKQMVRMETTQQMFMESTNQRFEQMLNMMDQRFAEHINQRFEQADKRFAEMMSFLQTITGIFTVIMAAAIGFAFWDRRTVLAKSKEVALEALAKDEEIRKIALVEQVTDEVLRRMDVRKATPLQAPPSPATA